LPGFLALQGFVKVVSLFVLIDTGDE
jgi:hypothetical protein